MRRSWLGVLILTVCSHSAWAIYGPDLARADISVALQACQEADFQKGEAVTKAIATDKPEDTLEVLSSVIHDWKNTPTASPLYAARAFCLHELIPARLQPAGDPISPTRPDPTIAVKRFHELGMEYFYYDPDDEFTLRKNPVNLEKLAMDFQDSRWGRQAFLMMTLLGWSWGACAEGPDRFREVIKRGEIFLDRYPISEVSKDIRLEVANAYATWWNLSRLKTNGPDNPASYIMGSREAKRKAIELYQDYLNEPHAADVDVLKRLKSLQENPVGSGTYDYWCSDYED